MTLLQSHSGPSCYRAVRLVGRRGGRLGRSCWTPNHKGPRKKRGADHPEPLRSLGRPQTKASRHPRAAIPSWPASGIPSGGPAKGGRLFLRGFLWVAAYATSPRSGHGLLNRPMTPSHPGGASVLGAPGRARLGSRNCLADPDRLAAAPATREGGGKRGRRPDWRAARGRGGGEGRRARRRVPRGGWEM